MKNYLFSDATCVFMQIKFEVDFFRTTGEKKNTPAKSHPYQ